MPDFLDRTQILSTSDAALGLNTPPPQIGRYQIISTLGSGNMGTVYLAHDPLIGRTVALKVVDRNQYGDQDEQFDQLFRQEIQAIGQLTHPNIIAIHDAELTGTTAYFAMEYVKGKTLKELLDAGVKLPLDRVRDFIGQAAEGLQHAHQHNIVHRDIKPANIMVTLNGTIKIMDFGIAITASADASLESSPLGTPRYMSPEQFLNAPLDSRVDIYALGTVLYELLTGEAPFTADSLETLRHNILHDDPLPPSRLNLHLGQNYDHITARALSKMPEARYQDVRELAMDVMRAGKSGLTWSKAQYDLEKLSVKQLLNRLLKSVWLFKGFRMDEMVEFLLHTEKTVAFPEQEIIHEGSPGEFVYILVAGHVNVIKETRTAPGRYLPHSSRAKVSAKCPWWKTAFAPPLCVPSRNAPCCASARPTSGRCPPLAPSFTKTSPDYCHLAYASAMNRCRW